MELHDPGFMMFDAEVRQDQSIQDAKAAMVKTLDDAAGASPVTKEEVERARATILKNIDLMLNNADRVGLNLSEYIGQGDWRLFFLTRDRIRSASVEDVQKAAAAYLKPSNRTIGVFLPTAKPDRAEVPAPILAGDAVKDYKGDAAIAAGEAFEPSPANIESRTNRPIRVPTGSRWCCCRRRRAAPPSRRTDPVTSGREKPVGQSTVADPRPTCSCAAPRSTRASRSKTSSTA